MDTQPHSTSALNLGLNRLILALLSGLIFLSACRTPAPPSATQRPTVTSLPQPTPTPTPPSPEGTAVGFLEAWQAGDYDTMYHHLAPESRAGLSVDAFVRRYRNALNSATALTIETQLQALLKETDRATATFDLTLNTALFGPLEASPTMTLVLRDGRWTVDWDAGLIWPQLAGGRYFRLSREVPVRANIYDRDGLALASQGTIVTISVVPGEIEDENALLAALTRVTGIGPDEIKARYANVDPTWRVPIADVPGQISVENNALLSDIAGIHRDEKKGRIYPTAAAPHVVGWVAPVPAEALADYKALGYQGDERVGVSGLEAWGEEILAGRQGGTLNIVTASGEPIETVTERSAQPSRAIHTSLDREFQLQVQEILGDRKGAIVVLDAQTGALRAMASGPGFDPNAFSDPTRTAELSQIVSDPRHPLINRATQGTYPSASVFKIVTMSAAVEEASMTPGGTGFFCPGYWDGLGTAYRKGCWKEDGHGDILLQDGLTASCDVVFYEVGKRLDEAGPDILPEMARGFALGQPTDIEGIIEEAGLVPDPEWKTNTIGENWWVGDTVNLAIGQGYLLVTPLQIARAVAAVGNGGTLYRPYVVERIAANGDLPEAVTEPEAIGQIPVGDEHLRAIQDALLGVTTRSIGTAPHRFEGLSIPVAGKTGTAEVGGPDSEPHSWFAAYAPADDPELAIAIIVENAGEGSTVAAPMTRQVVEAYYDLPLTPLPALAQPDTETPAPTP